MPNSAISQVHSDLFTRNYALFRAGDVRRKGKSKGKRNEEMFEKLYESDMSRIIEEQGTEKVRMLLPTKTRNGVVEKRLAPEYNDRDAETRSNEVHGRVQADDRVEMETCLRVSIQNKFVG